MSYFSPYNEEPSSCNITDEVHPNKSLQICLQPDVKGVKKLSVFIVEKEFKAIRNNLREYDVIL